MKYDCQLVPALFEGLSCKSCFLRCKLTEGQNIIGRDNVAGGSRRISSKQLILMWESDIPRLRVSCGREHGSSILVRKECGSVIQLSKRGLNIEVFTGDRLTLDVNDHPCEVQITPLGKPSSSLLQFQNYNNTRLTGGPPSLNALKSALVQLRDKQPTDDARVFFNNRRFLFIYDAFPKSCFHLLGFCLNLTTATPSDLTINDLREIQDMHSIAKEICNSISMFVEWQVGYHGTPSLNPLHCHVMSTDLSSSCMKTKKHYVSFIPPNFISADEIERRLQIEGQIVIAAEDKIDVGLSCRWCHQKQTNIPKLKSHLESCRPYRLA